MSVAVDNAQWIEAQQKDFDARIGAALAFWPELKRAFVDLAEQEPVKSRVKVNTAEEDPYLLTVSAGLFDLKFAVDVLSDMVFYAFTSAALKRVIPRESAIFYHGHLKLTRGPWGVIDNPGPDVHKVFADDPQSVQYLSLADRVARASLEKLLGGYPAIAALEEAAVAKAKAQEEAAKKEARRDRPGSE
jgi:hypothetical protein